MSLPTSGKFPVAQVCLSNEGEKVLRVLRNQHAECAGNLWKLPGQS